MLQEHFLIPPAGITTMLGLNTVMPLERLYPYQRWERTPGSYSFISPSLSAFDRDCQGLTLFSLILLVFGHYRKPQTISQLPVSYCQRLCPSLCLNPFPASNFWILSTMLSRPHLPSSANLPACLAPFLNPPCHVLDVIKPGSPPRTLLPLNPLLPCALCWKVGQVTNLFFLAIFKLLSLPSKDPSSFQSRIR